MSAIRYLTKRTPLDSEIESLVYSHYDSFITSTDQQKIENKKSTHSNRALLNALLEEAKQKRHFLLATTNIFEDENRESPQQTRELIANGTLSTTQDLRTYRQFIKTQIDPFLEQMLGVAIEPTKLTVQDKKTIELIIRDIYSRRNRLLHDDKKRIITRTDLAQKLSKSDQEEKLMLRYVSKVPSYNSITKCIQIGAITATKYSTPLILLHERMHSVQDQQLVSMHNDCTEFTEGHSIGMELKWVEKTADPADYLKFYKHRISELHTPFLTTIHGVGYAAFMIAESRYGTDIYKDTLKEPMLLLDILRAA